jgi:RNA-binding protein 26
MMRGGSARASMTLDNRPKKLLVKGVVEDGLQALRDWYEVCFYSHSHSQSYSDTTLCQAIGQMESVEKLAGGDVVVTFKSRNAAEQAGLFLAS